jgi:hypothetical protein
MTAPVRNPTTPDVVFATIRQRLIDTETFTPSCVFVVTDREASLNVPPGTIYGIVQPGRFRFDQRQIAGGGRSNVKAEWDVSIVVMANIGLDQGDRAAQWLLNSAGVIVRSSQVLDALLCVDLIDGDGNGLLTEPMRPSGGDVRAKPGKFGELAVDFTVSFVWNMPTDYTSPVY